MKKHYSHGLDRAQGRMAYNVCRPASQPKWAACLGPRQCRAHRARVGYGAAGARGMARSPTARRWTRGHRTHLYSNYQIRTRHRYTRTDKRWMGGRGSMRMWGWLPNTDGVCVVRATPVVGGALATFMSWSRSQARSVVVSTRRKKDHSLRCSLSMRRGGDEVDNNDRD
jgi:hypothetical protein